MKGKGKLAREETDDMSDLDVDWLRESAVSQGSAEAQLRLGKLHLRGQLVPQDHERALHLFELAASAGNAGAQFALGFMYELGLGISSNDDLALHWYKLAADQGHPTAMFGLATMLSQGSSGGGPEALKWFSQAAELGDVEAQCELADMMMRGRGIPEDLDGATAWFLKAAQEDSPCAQTSLGSMAARGLGRRSKDDQEALRWFSLAAWQYHAPGMKHLGDMYLHGRGVRVDYEEAAKWYRLAVQQGADYAPALKALGDMFSSGRGVPKSMAEALRLYGMASELRKAQMAEEALTAKPSNVSTANQVSLQMQATPGGSSATRSEERCKAIWLFSGRAFDIVTAALTCHIRSNGGRSRRSRR